MKIDWNYINNYLKYENPEYYKYIIHQNNITKRFNRMYNEKQSN